MKNSEALREMSTNTRQFLCHRIPTGTPIEQYLEIKALIRKYIYPNSTFEGYLERITNGSYQFFSLGHSDNKGDPRYDFVQDMRARLCIFLAEQEEAKGK